MKEEIKINWTPELKEKIIMIVDKWIKDHGAYSGEHVGQCDDCQIDAPELVAEIADILDSSIEEIN